MTDGEHDEDLAVDNAANEPEDDGLALLALVMFFVVAGAMTAILRMPNQPPTD